VTLFFRLSVCSFVSDKGVCEIIKTFCGVVNLLSCLVQEPRLVSSRNVVTLFNYKSSLLRGVSGFFVLPLGFPVTERYLHYKQLVRFLRSCFWKSVTQFVVESARVHLCVRLRIHVLHVHSSKRVDKDNTYKREYIMEGKINR